MTYKRINIIPEIFASIIAVVAGFLIYVSRLGLDNYGELIIKSIFVSFFLIYSPHFVKVIVLNKVSKEWYFSKAFLIFVGMIILVLTGRVSIFLDLDLSYTIALLGGVVFVNGLVGQLASWLVCQLLGRLLAELVQGLCQRAS